MLRCLVPLAAVGLAACAHNVDAPGSNGAQAAQVDPARAAAEPTISEATLKRVTRELSDDRFEGARRPPEARS